MKKQLLASLLSLFLVAGLAPVTKANTAACCSGSSDCAMDSSPSCPYKVLTKDECHRFCQAKAAAIAKDPSLAKPENKRKLCRAIVKADPSMRPICMKLRKNCCKMKKHCMNSSSTSATSSSAQPSSSSSSSSQQSANANSSSSMSSDVAAQNSPAASSSSQPSSSTTTAN